MPPKLCQLQVSCPSPSHMVLPSVLPPVLQAVVLNGLLPHPPLLPLRVVCRQAENDRQKTSTVQICAQTAGVFNICRYEQGHHVRMLVHASTLRFRPSLPARTSIPFSAHECQFSWESAGIYDILPQHVAGTTSCSTAVTLPQTLTSTPHNDTDANDCWCCWPALPNIPHSLAGSEGWCADPGQHCTSPAGLSALDSAISAFEADQTTRAAVESLVTKKKGRSDTPPKHNPTQAKTIQSRMAGSLDSMCINVGELVGDASASLVSWCASCRELPCPRPALKKVQVQVRV